MLRIKNICFATLQYQEAKGSFVFLSSFHLVRRRFSKEAEEMSGQSLSKWIAPAIKDLFTILLKDRCKAWINL